MDAKFFDSLFEGDSANGVKLGMGITGGDFWPRPAGCHTVYRGQDGEMDYDNIMAVMSIDDSQVTIASQSLPAGTIWDYRRRQVSDCGLESPDPPSCIVVIDADGDMVGNVPNAPVSLTIEQIAGGKLKPKWRYTPLAEEIAPTGFNIYQDSGAGFNFASPIGTVNYLAGKFEYDWTSIALVHGTRYRFVVRSYRTGGGEEQNLNIISEVADAEGPAAITGLRTTWQGLNT